MSELAFAHYVLHVASRVKYVPRPAERPEPSRYERKPERVDRAALRARYEEMRRDGMSVTECRAVLGIPKSTAYVWEGGV